MKILIIPDVHQTTRWQKLLKNTSLISKYDKVIQLGDWFDTWKPNWKDNMPIRNFNLAIDIAKNNPKFDVLLGNHDFSYISDVHCSGYQADRSADIRKAIFDAAPFVNIVKEYDGWVFSHAGVSSLWMNDKNLTTSEQINDVFHFVTIPFYTAQRRFMKQCNMKFTTALKLKRFCENDKSETSNRDKAIYEEAINYFVDLFGVDAENNIDNIIKQAKCFEFNGIDCYGDDAWQTPVWIRPSSLFNNMYFNKQVVGHTEYEKVVDINENGKHLVIVDSPNHDFYVELDTETNEVKKIEEVK